MRLLIMAALYYWGNLFLYKADKIFYEEAGLNKKGQQVQHIEAGRTRRINNAIEKHMRLESFLKLH